MSESAKHIVLTRLKPLYLVSFFQGLILWYAIEKVFMSQIGFSAFLIALSVVIMNLAILSTEIPAGILADRWSRKKVLILSIFMLGLSTTILGLSSSVPLYLIGVVFYGLHFALFSGLNESIVYDTLLDVQASRDGFEGYYGRTRTLNSAALVAGSVLGGLVASSYGLKYAYLLSVPSCIFALCSAFMFKEPKAHQESETTYLLHHIKETFKQVWHKGYVGWIVISMISISIITSFLLEVDQLWPLALALPLILYGPLNALLLFGYGLGGPLANEALKHKLLPSLICVIGFVGVIALSVRNMPLIAISQFVIICVFSALFIISSGKFHDTLPSQYRAGASSIVSTITTLCFLPLVLLFGYVTENTSIFTASYILIPVAVISIVGFLRINRSTQ